MAAVGTLAPSLEHVDAAPAEGRSEFKRSEFKRSEFKRSEFKRSEFKKL
jgi:hypothetical protein